MEPPVIAGHEFSGRVVKLGSYDGFMLITVGHVHVQHHFSVVKVFVPEHVALDKSVNLLLYSLNYCTTVVVQY